MLEASFCLPGEDVGQWQSESKWSSEELGGGGTGFPTQKREPNAPGMHVKNKCLLLFKDGGTRQWEQRHRMRERKDGLCLSPEYSKQQLHEGSEQMEAYTLKKRKRDCSVDRVCQGGSGHLPTRWTWLGIATRLSQKQTHVVSPVVLHPL